MSFALAIYFLAALCEIGGCFSFWLVFRLSKSPLNLIWGVLLLLAFAYLLTKIDIEFAGRAYAIYGGIYIVSSLFWLFFIEKESLNLWDFLGTSFVFVGIFIMLFGNLALNKIN